MIQVMKGSHETNVVGNLQLQCLVQVEYFLNPDEETKQLKGYMNSQCVESMDISSLEDAEKARSTMGGWRQGSLGWCQNDQKETKTSRIVQKKQQKAKKREENQVTQAT